MRLADASRDASHSGRPGHLHGRSRLSVIVAQVSGNLNEDTLRVGNISLRVPVATSREHVPALYGPTREVPDELADHLMWLLQKFRVAQDAFLIGPPGPFRRRLAMWCCEVLGREVEYVALSRDTTENDLKQRREIVNGDLQWVDQAPVRAALEGRVLILDGIEKAERNVLPTLNNLLENREMQLQDGRFLASPSRLKDGEAYGNLVRVSPHFRVIALGLPVPAFPGYLLDPPLRSRFQGHYLGAFTATEHLGMLRREYPNLDVSVASTLVGCLVSLRELWLGALRGENPFKVLPCSEDLPRHVAALITTFPALKDQLFSLMHRVYPAAFFQYEPSTYKAVQHALQAQGLTGTLGQMETASSATCAHFLGASRARARFESLAAPVHVPMGSAGSAAGSAEIPASWTGLLSAIVQDFSIGRDVVIVGAAGEGKTAFVRSVAAALQFSLEEVFTIQCFKDMTDRDLVQRRITDLDGNTFWRDTPLVQAAEKGGLLVIDGLHRLAPGALAAVQSLVYDRDLWLPDGTHMVSQRRFQRLNAGNAIMKRQGGLVLRCVSDNFRIIALGTPQTDKVSEQWITAELLPLFSWHSLPPLPDAQKLPIMAANSPGATDNLLGQLLELNQRMLAAAKGNKSWALSLRQLLRLSRRAVKYPDGLTDDVRRTVMSAFWPVSVREPFEQLLSQNFSAQVTLQPHPNEIKVQISDNMLDIGGAKLQLGAPERPELVPTTLFFENTKHLLRLREMVRDLALGEKHLLLIGNQGTGKNKLVDHLLQLLRWEREYIQLHRDTTVQSLTVQPTLEAGVVGWEDSPLVRAVRTGRALVCDEADKAPTEVVCVLKGLVEDGEMHLADGRRILRGHSDNQASGVIPVHPDFRLFVLANRPGFPFMGNDFFRECGDVFSVHVIENPDHESEVEMLRRYAPDVPEETLRRLSAAFTDVRELVDDGKLQYPYSTRELVNIVKHLQVFPDAPLQRVLAEVFDFEEHDTNARALLKDIFENHGISLTGGGKEDEDTPQMRSPQHLRIERQASNAQASLQEHEELLLRALEHLNHRYGSARGPSPADAVRDAFSASVAATLARHLRRRSGEAWPATLDRLAAQAELPANLQRALQLSGGAAVASMSEDRLSSSLQDAITGRTVMEQLQALLSTSPRQLPDGAVGQPVEQARQDMAGNSESVPETPWQALAAEIAALQTGSTTWQRKLPLGSEREDSPPLGAAVDALSAMEEAVSALESAAGSIDQRLPGAQVSSAAMAMKLAELAEQVSVWQLAEQAFTGEATGGQPTGDNQSSSSEDQLLEQASGNGDGAGQADGNIRGAGSGARGGGGAGSGGSGSGARTGEGGGQGGDLESDGRGGYSDEALAGLATASQEESEQEVHARAHALQEKVKEINERIEINESLTEMSRGDPRGLGNYEDMLKAVERQVHELRMIFDAAEAKEKEREWLNNQTSGDLDDNKLIDGVTGEKLIYRRRGTPDKPVGLFQRLPKRLLFVVDVSASMARFNGQDGRLDRMAQTLVMVLEALHGRDQKFEYAVVGHSGNSASIPFVDFGRPPRAKVERSRIIQKMVNEPGIAASGDSTLAATELAIQVVAEKEADEHLVFVLSDANLGAYDVTPEAMSETLCRNDKVKAFAVFLSEPHAARHLQEGLPVGKGHVCLDVSELPATFKAIFANAAAD